MYSIVILFDEFVSYFSGTFGFVEVDVECHSDFYKDVPAGAEVDVG